MTRKIRISFPANDVSCEAVLLDERAPKTCAAIWECLPLEGQTVHGRWSGPELFICNDHLVDLEQENAIHRTLPGDVCYWMCPEGKYASSPQRAVEILFIYDRGAAIMGPDGQPTFANLFAQITGDWDAFRAAAKAVRTEGSLLLRIERVQEQ